MTDPHLRLARHNPPLPKPNAADVAEATRFVDVDYAAQVTPEYLAFHRDGLIRTAAEWERIARVNREWRAERRAAA